MIELLTRLHSVGRSLVVRVVEAILGWRVVRVDGPSDSRDGSTLAAEPISRWARRPGLATPSDI